MARKSSSRKYQLTINNPLDKGYTHQVIKDTLNKFSLIYACLCDEIGEQGTPHTHIFFIAKSGVMFDTVQKRFIGAHIEKAKGTNEENRNYITKKGEKFKDKVETNLPNTFEEIGTLPPDKSASSALNEEIYEMIQNGCNEYEILDTYPNALNKIDKIRKAIEIVNKEKFKDQIRYIHTTYIWGESGTGKTRSVVEKYGYSNVYRVTDYTHPFDDYDGQDVILFEEFRSSLLITDMLKYLDLYPVMLPCRYANKVAMFTKVYFATNIPLEKQYTNIQQNEPETYKAFVRRIHEVIELIG